MDFRTGALVLNYILQPFCVAFNYFCNLPTARVACIKSDTRLLIWFAGEDEHGWGLSHKGLLWHAGKWSPYTKPFRENEPTTVGILFDGIAGTLSFFKDGCYLGVAFHGLEKVNEPLYPIVCSTAAKTEMTLSVMRRDFVSLQVSRIQIWFIFFLNPSDH